MPDLSDTPSGYARALTLGFASGLRSMAGPAMIARLGPPPVRWLFLLLSAGEAVADKLPGIPDRIAPGPLAGRVISGAVVGGVVCRAAGRSPWLGAVLGVAGAVTGAYGGYLARKALGTRLPDPVLALAEDSLAVALGRWSVS